MGPAAPLKTALRLRDASRGTECQKRRELVTGSSWRRMGRAGPSPAQLEPASDGWQARLDLPAERPPLQARQPLLMGSEPRCDLREQGW